MQANLSSFKISFREKVVFYTLNNGNLIKTIGLNTGRDWYSDPHFIYML